MTREEILAKNMDCADTTALTLIETRRDEEGWEIAIKEALNAMKEYAQQEVDNALKAVICQVKTTVVDGVEYCTTIKKELLLTAYKVE